MSTRYIAATSGWRKWSRWLRVLCRPYLATYRSINRCWHRDSQRTAPLSQLEMVDAQWTARRFEMSAWNIARERAWEAKVRDYPHGIAQAYIGGPLVIP